jgi:hypothetical protein
MGLWADYAAVFARVLVDENDYGVQVFNVPIRDPETRELLPGV